MTRKVVLLVALLTLLLASPALAFTCFEPLPVCADLCSGQVVNLTYEQSSCRVICWWNSQQVYYEICYGGPGATAPGEYYEADKQCQDLARSVPTCPPPGGSGDGEIFNPDESPDDGTGSGGDSGPDCGCGECPKPEYCF